MKIQVRVFSLLHRPVDTWKERLLTTKCIIYLDTMSVIIVLLCC